MDNNKELTNSEKCHYNEGVPIHCECKRVVACIKDNKILIKCPSCRKWIPLINIIDFKAQ